MNEKKSLPFPDWLPGALAVAQHEDRKASWPRWQRFLHWLLVSWRCPCYLKARADRKKVMKLFEDGWWK